MRGERGGALRVSIGELEVLGHDGEARLQLGAQRAVRTRAEQYLEEDLLGQQRRRVPLLLLLPEQQLEHAPHEVAPLLVQLPRSLLEQAGLNRAPPRTGEARTMRGKMVELHSAIPRFSSRAVRPLSHMDARAPWQVHLPRNNRRRLCGVQLPIAQCLDGLDPEARERRQQVVRPQPIDAARELSRAHVGGAQLT